MTATTPVGTVSRTRLANETWEALLGAHGALMRRFAERPGLWDEVSMREYDVLYTLSKCERPQRLGDLSRHVLLSQPGLSRLVDRLVERGLVARCTDSADGRALNLSLTDAGREAQRRIGRVHARDIADALASLDEAELHALAGLAAKMAAGAALTNVQAKPLESQP